LEFVADIGCFNWFEFQEDLAVFEGANETRIYQLQLKVTLFGAAGPEPSL
jgi:hypothetical protein